MMNYFYIENSQDITNSDLQNLRMFYTPIIGPSAISLYQHLLDLHNLYNKDKKYDFAETSEFLLLNEQLLFASKDKLEAVGLLKTYQLEDGWLLFELIKPLNANEIANNPLMSNLIKDNIGENRYKEIVNAKANFSFKKENLKEVSKKYYEVFEIKEDILKPRMTQFDFTISNYDNVIDDFKSEDFVENFTKLSISPSQKALIKKLRELNFNDTCINRFMNFSIKVNHAIVCSYVEKIAKDYANRNLFSADAIDTELSAAYFAKTSQKEANYSYNNRNIEYENAVNNMRFISEDLDWDD
ncbi:DnaD domain protein [Metamycoplasma neophronis]|uniref:Replicative helicase loading/DNA remodeling protein DnaB N-terminal winged helix domain-containing protein n=1 Tax=Metamycoplasma neophronis TaxID=872983 RepID=A0ABY2Z415_9BACT|nr:DnaD domain protein [Metamycoplasma neophronis]TPR53890.1 hypothetical protein FJR74_01865 [Metamycoplasma neophronis]